MSGIYSKHDRVGEINTPICRLRLSLKCILGKLDEGLIQLTNYGI